MVISLLPTAPVAARRALALILATALALVPVACTADTDDGAAPGASTTEAPATDAGGDAPETTAGATEPGPDPTETEPDTTESEAPPTAAPNTYAVGSLDETVVDTSRVTAAQGDEPERPERTLPALVLYPATGAAEGGGETPDAPPEPGPWPLVVFSHGLGGAGPNYAATLRVWASAGYVVVAPSYPLSNTNAPGGPSPSDIPEQTADVAYLIDWAVEQSDATDGPLAGMVDPERVGVSGHSLGGFTSLGAAYNPCCRDEQIAAVAEWAGAYVPELGPDGGDAVDDGPPLLIVHGDADGTVPYEQALAVRDAVSSTAALVTLVGGEHIPPFVQGLGEPQSAVVTSTTLAFFDQHLKDDPEGADRLQAAVDEAGPELATVELADG